MVSLDLDWIFPLIVIAGFGLAELLIFGCAISLNDCMAEKQAAKQSKIEELEREVERLKGFPLIKVEYVKIGQIVSNADSIYLCISNLNVNHEKKFLDLINKEIVSVQFKEEVRKRDDLNLELSKIIGG